MSTGPHLFWITSRAAGTAAVILASASVALGILMGRRATGEVRLGDLRAVHETLSLAALAMIGLHGVSLLGDHYFHPGITGISIPFTGHYRPLWTGVGIIGGYGLAALGFSYYARDRIGPARWRRWHRFTALFWALGVAHSIGSGSDAGQLWFWVAAGLPAMAASTLVLGRTLRGMGKALDLPRTAPPIREGAGGGAPSG